MLPLAGADVMMVMVMMMLWMGTDLLPFQTVSVDVLTPVQPYQSRSPLGHGAVRGGAAATASNRKAAVQSAMRQSTMTVHK